MATMHVATKKDGRTAAVRFENLEGDAIVTFAQDKTSTLQGEDAIAHTYPIDGIFVIHGKTKDKEFSYAFRAASPEPGGMNPTWGIIEPPPAVPEAIADELEDAPTDDADVTLPPEPGNDAPGLSNLQPTTGEKDVPTDVTLTGTGFTSAGAKPQTKIGSGSWTDATFKSSPAPTDTSAKVSIPTDTVGTVSVRVANDDGESPSKDYTVTEPAQKSPPTLSAIAPTTGEADAPGRLSTDAAAGAQPTEPASGSAPYASGTGTQA